MTAEPVAEPGELNPDHIGLAEPETRPAKDSRGYFLPGNNANPYGRKGNPEKRTMVTEVRRKADRKASKLADALIETALKGNVRAFIAIRDTAYGVPAQKLVVEQAESPASTLLLAMLASGGINPRSQALLTQSSQDSHTHTSNTDE